MTTPVERRTRIRRDPGAYAIWATLLILQALSVIGLLILIGSASLLSSLLVGIPAVTGLTIGVGGIMLLMSLALWWGIWTLAAWVRVLLWVVAILGIMNLFNGQFWTGVMPILVAIGYTWLLRLPIPTHNPTQD